MSNVLKAKVNGSWVELSSGGGASIPTTTNLLKGDGSGGVTTASAGTDYQQPLVSGTNIKTINSTSVVGSGNIAVQETLVSGTNIKTINNESILGSGNITVSGGSSSTLKYGNSINKPFDFNNHKIGWYGDSIVAGISSPGLVTITDCFVKLFSDHAGATFTNHGVSGATMSAPNGLSSSTLCWHLNSGAASGEDIVIIAAGTNDHQQKVPLGSYGDTTYDTFYGGIDYICQKLATYNQGVPVIFITPINKTISVSGGEVAPLDDYRNAIFEVATKYGHSVVDGSTIGFGKTAGTSTSWQYGMLQDGVHPTADGHAMYARSLAGRLL